MGLNTQHLTATAGDVDRAAALLCAGRLVAMPTETVYGLAADALNAEAVERIFIAKGRPHWDPLIVHVSDEAMLRRVAVTIPAPARALMDAFWPGPLTLLLPRRPELPPAVTAGRELVGVRMPAHAVALALIAAAATPLAAPSANRFGHVSPTSAAHVLADLEGRIDAVLDAGPCTIGVESTVVEASEQEVRLYRAGGVSAAEIEFVTGMTVNVHVPIASGAVEPASLPSPGLGMRHYATRATVRLVSSQGELQRLVTMPEFRQAAVLLPSNWTLQNHAGPVRQWANAVDADRLAAQLYEGLRALDATGSEIILVPLPPRTDGLFAALQDRLDKASRAR